MQRKIRTFAIHATAVTVAALVLGTAGKAAVVPLYAIRGARVVTAAGPTIDRATVLMRNGVIEDVGANVTVPVDAMVIEGNGLTVYPGLIDMANSTAVDPGVTAASTASAGAAGGGGGRGAGQAAPAQTLEDLERAKRAQILRPDFEAARHLRIDGAEMQRLAAAGITSVLAVPPAGTFRGQSALVNVLAPPDDVQYSNIGEYRGGLTVIKSPVALHVAFGAGTGGGGGGGYPGSLLGYIAFVRQSFYDAQWQRDARAFATRHADAPRQEFEPALDAMAAALERKLPVSFDASEEREIMRALTMAKEFNLDPIITGAADAASVTADLKAANARVIYSLNFQGAGGGGGGGGRGGGGGGGDTLRVVRARVNAPRVPAALEKAGVPFAFTSGGSQTPGDFLRNAARTVKEGNLAADAALRALTVNAAKLAGASDRLGTVEKGKIANVIVVDGDLFDGGRIRHVFIDGRPVDIDVVAPPATGRGGRGGSGSGTRR
jgi:imidazolonepropionase-like amidohydrolase